MKIAYYFLIVDIFLLQGSYAFWSFVDQKLFGHQYFLTENLSLTEAKILPVQFLKRLLTIFEKRQNRTNPVMM